MPIVVLPFLALAVGGAIALTVEGAGRERRRYTVMRDRASTIVWLVTFLVLAPNAAYFVCRYPDWSVAYLFRASRLPSAVTLLAACAGAALAGVGFRAGLALVREEKRRALILGIGASLGAATVVVAVLGRRLWSAGTFESWKRGDEMQTLAGSWLGLGVVLMNALGLIGVWFALAGPTRPRTPGSGEASPLKGRTGGDARRAGVEAPPIRAPRGPMPKLRGDDLRRG
ncbi:MAG: hypothetical protein U0414_34300 [Polyangiaceae bacterium]